MPAHAGSCARAHCGGTWQMRSTQSWPLGQALPHAPQFALSLVKFTQLAVQRSGVLAAHSMPQDWLSSQMGLPPGISPQRKQPGPQAFGEFKGTRTPSQGAALRCTWHCGHVVCVRHARVRDDILCYGVARICVDDLRHTLGHHITIGIGFTALGFRGCSGSHLEARA